jgi:hypothetical protein
MQATVVAKDPEGFLTVRVRRNQRDEQVYDRHPAVLVGQCVEVKRQANHPYLLFVTVVRYERSSSMQTWKVPQDIRDQLDEREAQADAAAGTPSWKVPQDILDQLDERDAEKEGR